MTYDTGAPIANGRGLCLVGANFGASFQEFIDLTATATATERQVLLDALAALVRATRGDGLVAYAE